MTGNGKNLNFIKKSIKNEEKKLLKIIKKYVYGFDNDELESSVGNLLISKNKTLAIAKSCSGGFASHMITSVPGSSKYFSGSIIAYSNSIKINNLNVNEDNIKKYGSVSKKVVEEMAVNVRKKFNSSIGIATSGIAGPDGGTKEKPIGTVWIGISDNKATYSKKLMLTERRDVNITLSSVGVLNMVRLNLEGYRKVDR